jgi:hypothetical protein
MCRSNGEHRLPRFWALSVVILRFNVSAPWDLGWEIESLSPKEIQIIPEFRDQFSEAPDFKGRTADGIRQRADRIL